MSLKERLKNRKEEKLAARAQACRFDISIKKVTEAAEKMENPADLGNIVKEFAKFLNTLASEDAKITFSGNFDLGQRTLLNCVLSSFLTDSKKSGQIIDSYDVEEPEEIKPEPKLIRKRKTVRERVKEALKEEE